MDTILVTGGTGFIGKHLCNQLKTQGYNITILSRRKSSNPNSYYWNIQENHIDKEAIINADYIIHLAGAGIADSNWTKKRKQLLFDSRINTTYLLFQKVKELNPKLKGFIAASGIGYYGAKTTNQIFTELDESGKDFLSYICKFWEKSSLQFNSIKIRTVIFRTGLVLGKNGGAFEKLSKPIKLGIGSALGKGTQIVPWIHIDDLCTMYIKAIENEKLMGIYNAVAPDLTTNKSLTQTIAKILKKTLWLPNIPSFVLRILLGKMSIIVLQGSAVSSKKIENTGFKFKFPKLIDSIKDLL